jgi:hypothetical protein
LLAAAQARRVADADAIADTAFLADLMAAFNAAVDDALQVRWPALSAEQLAALVRLLYRVRSRLDATVLAAVKAVDDRDDVVPVARPGRGGSHSWSTASACPAPGRDSRWTPPASSTSTAGT